MKTRPDLTVVDKAAVIGWRGAVPVIAAAVVGGELRFWCDYCREPHVHSRGEERRAAHCRVEDSPFKASGYYLKAYVPDVPLRAA